MDLEPFLIALVTLILIIEISRRLFNSVRKKRQNSTHQLNQFSQPNNGQINEIGKLLMLTIPILFIATDLMRMPDLENFHKKIIYVLIIFSFYIFGR